ncbi:hypothetical protein ACLB2K_006323 [Fragaria x ananassa]
MQGCLSPRIAELLAILIDKEGFLLHYVSDVGQNAHNYYHDAFLWSLEEHLPVAALMIFHHGEVGGMSVYKFHDWSMGGEDNEGFLLHYVSDVGQNAHNYYHDAFLWSLEEHLSVAALMIFHHGEVGGMSVYKFHDWSMSGEGTHERRSPPRTEGLTLGRAGKLSPLARTEALSGDLNI